jgi:hypothetical protein
LSSKGIVSLKRVLHRFGLNGNPARFRELVDRCFAAGAAIATGLVPPKGICASS